MGSDLFITIFDLYFFINNVIISQVIGDFDQWSKRNPDMSKFWMVEKRLVCKLFGLQMGSEIWKSNGLKSGQKNILFRYQRTTDGDVT